MIELLVIQLRLGSLTGAYSKNSPREGGAVIMAVIVRGVNFIDTAELDVNYLHLKETYLGEGDDIILVDSMFTHI